MKMKLLVASVLLVSIFAGGCTLSDDSKGKLAQTGSLIASKAASVALNAVVYAATNPGDREKGSDFLHSAAAGLRSEMPNIVTADDVRKVVAVWTPASDPRFVNLAGKVADVYAEAKAPEAKAVDRAKAVESIAAGLQSAASK